MAGFNSRTSGFLHLFAVILRNSGLFNLSSNRVSPSRGAYSKLYYYRKFIAVIPL